RQDRQRLATRVVEPKVLPGDRQAAQDLGATQGGVARKRRTPLSKSGFTLRRFYKSRAMPGYRAKRRYLAGALECVAAVRGLSKHHAYPLAIAGAKTMVDLHHNVPINAAPEKVFTAIATQEGMRGWWTRDATLDSKVGGKAEFGF